jgi:FlaA1/EpsC-like NDP-sugar epimerase
MLIMERVVGLGRYQKRAIQIGIDLLVFSAVLAAILAFRNRGYLPRLPTKELLVFAVAPVLSLMCLFYLDVYRLVLRYVTADSVLRIAASLALSTVLWFGLYTVAVSGDISRTILFGYPIAGTLAAWGWRQAGRWFLNLMHNPPRRHAVRRTNVVIYGAGTFGVRLVNSLAQSQRFQIVAFVDQNKDLWGRYINGFRVVRPDRLKSLVRTLDVREVILAVPHVSRSERRQIVTSLEGLGVPVRTMPSYEELATGEVSVASLRLVGPDELLGREPVQAIPELLAPAIAGKCIMVTGAGGSIGSEIVRQVLPLGANRIVLFEASETALFSIEQDVLAILARMPAVRAPTLVPIIGSVTDERAMAGAITSNGVQIIYHAAAHKHVPLVEANPLAGLENNTLGTITAAKVAERLGVERFVLISTDKAVRPTNVMGASKRLAEIALQQMAKAPPSSPASGAAAVPATRTVFAIVRFGNVLGSSGSVLPTFRRQIEAGGPVTVTHPQIIRYFMSIPEAASLVLQAGAMAQGGEVFVLDMGEPVKIAKLAETMIRLMGLDVKTDENPDGDIAIKYTGLRPGEKLYEELFLGQSLEGTRHPSIMSSSEPIPAAFDEGILKLREAIAASDVAAARQVLVRLVEGFPAEAKAVGSAGKPNDARTERTLH